MKAASSVAGSRSRPSGRPAFPSARIRPASSAARQSKARPRPCRPSTPARSCRAGARGCDRRAPRTGGATADRPGGRLVQDQEVRVVDQRAAEAELLLHSARELARPGARGTGPGPWLESSSSMRRARARRARGRTGGRRSPRSRRPTASDRDSGPAPAACTRCAGTRARRKRRERMSPPSTSTVPVWSRRAPATRPSSVDLPTPSGPISPTSRPAGIVEVDGVERERLPVPMRWPSARARATRTSARHRGAGGSRTRRCSGHSARRSRRT